MVIAARPAVSEHAIIIDEQAVPEAKQLIAAGRAAAALPALDAVIRAYSLHHAHDNSIVRIARSPQESMHYTLAAALAKQPVKVLFNNWAEAYYQKSLAHTRLRQPEAADTALFEALALAPQNARFLLAWAERLAAAGNMAAAVAAFEAAEQASEFAPLALRAVERAQAIRGAAASLIGLGQPDRARERLRSGVAALPNDNSIAAALAAIEGQPRPGSENLF